VFWRLRSAGLVFVAAAAALVAVTGVGASGSASPRIIVPLDTSSSLSFSYPPQWNALGSALGSRFVTSHYASLAFVGTEPLHKPCLEAPAPCNPEAIDRLAPGNVYAKWSEVGMLGLPTPGSKVTVITVGGRSGRMVVEAGGWCSRYGTARTIIAVLPTPNSLGGLEFDACLRGPGIAVEQTAVETILQSTRFITSQ
jgi:hypothetical protein